MKLGQIVQLLDLKVFTSTGFFQREVTGAYAGDLLSHVMANTSPGFILVTIQTHENIVAVASLMELSAVIVTCGRDPGDKTIQMAEKQGIPLLGTSMTTFEIAGKLYPLACRDSWLT